MAEAMNEMQSQLYSNLQQRQTFTFKRKQAIKALNQIEIGFLILDTLNINTFL